MSVTQTTQQIQITGSLLSLNIFEQKLMRNFFIINTKLKKLDEMHELDIKIKALQKEQKFMNNKMEALTQKLPKDGGVSRNDIKIIAKDQVFEVLNSKDDRLNTCKYTEDLLKQIHGLKVDLARIRVQGPDALNNSPQQKNAGGSSSHRASFTAGQVLLQSNQKIPKDSLQQVLDKNELNIVDGILNEQNNPVITQINNKFEDVYRKIEQLKLGKMFNEYGEKDMQRFQKYEQYQLKSQQTARRLKQKPIRLDGIKKQNVKGQILKNDLYAEFQKSQLIKSQLNKNVQKKSVNNKGQTFTNFGTQNRYQVKVIEQTDQKPRLKPSRSIRKLEKIQRRLKLDDIKDINSVLRQIQLRIQGRVTHQIFMGFIQDIQQKLQILRITKDSTNQLSQLRKMLYSLQNRLQAVIIFIQNSTNEDDALLVKKQWTCISCDKNLQKYNAKVGQHLNWDNLSSKKISPTKAGAFGQTGQLASKIRTLMQNQKLGQQ